MENGKWQMENGQFCPKRAPALPPAREAPPGLGNPRSDVPNPGLGGFCCLLLLPPANKNNKFLQLGGFAAPFVRLSVPELRGFTARGGKKGKKIKKWEKQKQQNREDARGGEGKWVGR